MFTMLRAVLWIALFILKGAITLSGWVFRMCCTMRRKSLRKQRFKLVSSLRDVEIQRARDSQKHARLFLIKGDLPSAVDWRKRQRSHMDAARGYGQWLHKLKQAA